MAFLFSSSKFSNILAFCFSISAWRFVSVYFSILYRYWASRFLSYCSSASLFLYNSIAALACLLSIYICYCSFFNCDSVYNLDFASSAYRALASCYIRCFSTFILSSAILCISAFCFSASILCFSASYSLALIAAVILASSSLYCFSFNFSSSTFFFWSSWTFFNSSRYFFCSSINLWDSSACFFLSN